jgi:hypothetical protein
MAVIGPPAWAQTYAPLSFKDLIIELDVTSSVSPAAVDPFTLDASTDQLDVISLEEDTTPDGWILEADGRRGTLGTFSLADGDSTGPTGGNWVDISCSVMSFTCQRGGPRRTTEAQQAGTATFVLHDPTCAFDPTNSLGPYVFGGRTQLTGRRQIRVRANWAGIFWPIWSGYTEVFLPRYLEPGTCEVTIQCDGVFALWSTVDPPALLSPFGSGLTFDAHLAKCAEIARTPAALLQAATGLVPLQSHDFAGNVLSSAHLIVASEGGELIESKDGTIIARNRDHRLTASNSVDTVAIITDDETIDPGSILVYGLEPDPRLTDLINIVYASKVGGTVTAYDDSDSVVRFGAHSTRRQDLLIRDDPDVATWAGRILLTSSQTVVRLPQCEMQPPFSPLTTWLALAIEIGDRLEAKRSPLKGFAARSSIDQGVFVEGVRWAADAATKDITTQLFLSDASTLHPFTISGPGQPESELDGPDFLIS